MNDSTGIENEERHVPFISGDVRLDIVVTKIGDKEWSVSVINELGVYSTWWEFFESADIALTTALQAIQEEGVQEFTSIEGFEYLDGNDEDV
ncbi:MAG: hypothetical protein RIC85_06340 [Gammaproteobacteria bacterium]